MFGFETASNLGRLACFSYGVALPQPFLLDMDAEPRLVVRLMTKAPGPRCQVLGLVGWIPTLMRVGIRCFLKKIVQ